MSYLKPNFPVEEVTDQTKRWQYEYVGPTASLRLPGIGARMGQGFVTSAVKTPLTGTNPAMSEMSITVETRNKEIALNPDDPTEEDETTDEETDDETGASTAQYPTRSDPVYSCDWMAVERDIKEHPGFRSLTEDDVVDVENWMNEKDPATKKAKQYRVLDKNGTTTSTPSLSPLASKLATYINKGVRTFTDFAPVWRKSTTYWGVAPSNGSGVGQFSIPAGAPGGWEYVKTGDNITGSSRHGRWEHCEEWTGARYILLDSDTLRI